MRELVLATISEQPDIEVIGVVEDTTSLVEEVEQSRPDFLIIAQGRQKIARNFVIGCSIDFPDSRFLRSLRSVI
jgi:hypothetical protein